MNDETMRDTAMNDDHSGDDTVKAQEQEAQAPEEKETEKVSFKMDLYFWMQALAVALVLLILTFTLAGRVIRVVGSSMVPSLHENDLMLLQSVGYTPRQGDVVVLRKSTFMPEPIVKRVIAIGGQHVSIDYNANTVTVDGTVLDEPYILEYMSDPELRNRDMAISEVDVPEGSVFVMGDNRNNSSDSRNVNLGTVDTRYVLGRVLCVILPFDHMGAIH